MSVNGTAAILKMRPLRVLCVSGLFIFALLSSLLASATCRDKMIVAQIRPVKDSVTVVCFTKSQRFYKLPITTPRYKRYLSYLKWSEQQHMPVTVVRASEESDVIIQVVRSKAKKSSPQRREGAK